MRRRRGRSRVAIGTVRSTRGPLSAPLSVILAASLATVLTAAACMPPGGSGGAGGGAPTVYDALSLSYSGAGHQIFAYTHNGPSDTHLTVDLDGLDELGPSDVFLVFTNTGAGGQVLPAGEGGGVRAARTFEPGDGPPARTDAYAGAREIVELNSLPPSRFAPPAARGGALLGQPAAGPGEPGLGSPFEWIVYNPSNPESGALKASTTLRGKSLSGPPHDDRKTLVWVEDSEWSPNRGTSGRIDPDELDAVMEAFVDGEPSIYGMVREIGGEEWGPHGKTGTLIPSSTGQVHVVLYDIDWGAGGYFWAANNYYEGVTPYPTNEALVFFVDSDQFYDSTDPDDRTFFLRALAHEFQHMVHFYQKNVVRGGSPETWLNEMASLMMEDVVTTHILGPGYGPATRAWDFLHWFVRSYSTSTSLTAWNSTYADYTASYAFGGFLLRQVGAGSGAALLTRIIQSGAGGMSAVDGALTHVGAGIDADEALRRWGASLAVDPAGGTPEEPVPAGYGYPGDTSPGTYWGIHDLELEDASMYGYQNPQTPAKPWIYTVPPAVILGTTSVVWLYEENATGPVSAEVSLPPYTSLSVVVSPHGAGGGD